MNGSLAIGIIPIAVAIPTGSSIAQDRDRLEGWGPFKFSMSRVQAIEAIKPSAYFYGNPFIGYDTEIDGAKWHAVVEFSDDQSAINKDEITARYNRIADGPEYPSQGNCDQRAVSLSRWPT
jgi:hypothetical protein